jgi:RNA polymerase sigma-70 factor (ECF subfamily)
LAIEHTQAVQIITLYYNNIYNFCRSRLYDQHDAQDVTQEVFLTFYQKRETLEPETVKAWLFGVAHNKILHEYANAMKRSRFIPYDDLENCQDSCLSYNLEDISDYDDDRVEAIKKCILLHLSPDEQNLFLELYERHRKRSDVAKELNITEDALNMRSYRLRRKLKRALNITTMVLLYMYIKLQSK